MCNCVNVIGELKFLISTFDIIYGASSYHLSICLKTIPRVSQDTKHAVTVIINLSSFVQSTAEKHVVLYTNKSINDRVTHNEILFNVEMRNLSFLPLRLLY